MALGCKESFVSVMVSQPNTKAVKDALAPQGSGISSREKPRHGYQKEENPKNGLQKEATVLGTIQILCCLLIISLGAMLVSASTPPHFNTEISTIWTSGYPFIGALCFAISGSLSIVSGRKATKPYAMSSLTANSVSTVAATIGIGFLADSLRALGVASQLCDRERGHLSSLPYMTYYYGINQGEECFLAGFSLRGALVVMLIFTVLQFSLAAFSSFLWWKQAYFDSPGRTSAWSQSQGHVQQGKKNSPRTWI